MSKKNIIFTIIAILLFSVVSFFYFGISDASEDELDSIRSSLQGKLKTEETK